MGSYDLDGHRCVAVFQSKGSTNRFGQQALTTKGPITKIRLEPHTAASHIAILNNLRITHFLHFPIFSAQKIVAQEWSTGYGASEKPLLRGRSGSFSHLSKDGRPKAGKSDEGPIRTANTVTRWGRPVGNPWAPNQGLKRLLLHADSLNISETLRFYQWSPWIFHEQSFSHSLIFFVYAVLTFDGSTSWHFLGAPGAIGIAIQAVTVASLLLNTPPLSSSPSPVLFRLRVACQSFGTTVHVSANAELSVNGSETCAAQAAEQITYSLPMGAQGNQTDAR